MASRFAGWAVLNLLVAGPLLALLAAYAAAGGGSQPLQYADFNTHAWLTLMGWCAPVLCGLVYWLLPVLKESSSFLKPAPALSLLFLILGSLGLGAYLWAAHTSHSSLFLLAPAWGCYLVAGILYMLTVFRLTLRTLRPTATDLGLQAGAVWLVLVLAVRCAVALGALFSGAHDFLAGGEPAIQAAMLFGFVGNTGLALVTAVSLPFLGSPQPRATVLTSFRIYNAALGLWCGLAAWVLPRPGSSARVGLVLMGLALAYAVIRLLTELGLPQLLMGGADTPRRVAARTALGTGALLMATATVVLVLVSFWVEATTRAVPAQLGVLPMHLMAIGLFSNLVLALHVPLGGSRSVNQARGVLVWGAYGLLTVWLIVEVGLAVQGLVVDDAVWRGRYYAGWVAGSGAACLAAWLASVLRPAPRADSP
jgi:hypothetical protein